MTVFDSVINETDGKFNLGGKAGMLLSALLALMTDRNRGGFAGFLENFNRAGLGETASSWVNSNANTPISDEQLESALGRNTLDDFANQAGTDYKIATSATAYMIPRVVDTLTPEGIVPPESDLLSRVGGYLTGGAAGATVAETFDRIGTAAADTPPMNNRIDNNDLIAVDDNLEDDNSPLRWLLPLILLGMFLISGYLFCGKSLETVVAPTTNTNVNINANKIGTLTNMETTTTNSNAANR